MTYLAFISHSSEDTWVASQLAAACGTNGAATFLDEAKIAVGARFEDEILDALRSADELVVLATPWALDRTYVWMEIGAAWFRGIPIVVLLLGMTPGQFQARVNIPVALKERNMIALNSVDRYLSELATRASTRI
jgi:hypothetical protein